MPSDQETVALAIQHHQAGQFAQAERLYRQLLATNPQNPDLMNLLGAVYINLRDDPQAELYLREALRLNSEHQAAHDNLGVLLARQRRMDEAIASFRRALELAPNSVQTLLNLTSALLQQKQPAEAVELLRRVVALQPESPRGHEDLARVFYDHGRYAEALPSFREAARLKPQDPRAHFELAMTLALCGLRDEAIAAYQSVLRIKPDSAEACVNLANLYIDQQSYDTAVYWARRAISLRPRFAEAHLNLGSALTKQRLFDEAKAALREAARLKPELSQAYNNLGIVLAEEGEYDAAIEEYRRALLLQAGNVDAIYNLGIALHQQGHSAAAVEQFKHALQLRPDYAEARHNRAAALLMMGNFTEGLDDYEWRLKTPLFASFRPRHKFWNGEELSGRKLVLCAEQGLGDTLQFIRYAKELAARGATVLVECPPALHPLLARTPGVTRWIASPEEPFEADFCVPMLSVPQRLQTTLATIPADVPYLFAPPQLIEAWKQRLADWEGFKVGIVWQGNPQCPGDQFRSIPLAAFEPLARIAGVRLINLQKGFGAEQLHPVREEWRVVDFGDALDATGGAFMDTAAIMRNLDLVITSDTAAAHLAGGLGVPVWVALQLVPDWRWMADRDDSPWYPTMRLFRQRQRGDWSELFGRLAAELARLSQSA